MKKFVQMLIVGFTMAMCAVGLSPTAANAVVSTPIYCSDNVNSYNFGNQASNYEYLRNGVCFNTVQDGVTHRLVFQNDGNLVFYKGGVAKWQSGTANTGHLLAFQTDGNMVIYDINGAVKWSSGTLSTYTNVRTLGFFYQPGNVAFNYWGIYAQTPQFNLLWRTSS